MKVYFLSNNHLELEGTFDNDAYQIDKFQFRIRCMVKPQNSCAGWMAMLETN